MDQQNLSVPTSTQVRPARRLIAAGLIRRLDDRTLSVRITEAGVTGRITPTPQAQTFDDDSDDACPLCGNWTCTCGSTARAARTSPAAIYMAAATADHLTRCTRHRERDTEFEARYAQYGASTGRRDRTQLGLRAVRTEAVNGR